MVPWPAYGSSRRSCTELPTDEKTPRKPASTTDCSNTLRKQSNVSFLMQRLMSSSLESYYVHRRKSRRSARTFPTSPICSSLGATGHTRRGAQRDALLRDQPRNKLGGPLLRNTTTYNVQQHTGDPCSKFRPHSDCSRGSDHNLGLSSIA